MSVPVGERDEGKFTLAVKAEYLASYTLEITANEKVFLPAYLEGLTKDIVETAKDIYFFIREANDVTVRIGTPFHLQDYADRNRLQRMALRRCKRLLYLIDLAHRRLHLSTKRVKYWSQITKNVKDRVSGWIDDDTKRFMPS